MVPLLIKHISHTQLAFFGSFFLPMSQKFREIATRFERGGNTIQQKVFETIALQIWELLPAFCNHATDVVTVS